MEIVWKHKNLEGITVAAETAFKHPTVEGLRLRVYPTGRKTWQWIRMLDGKALKKSLGKFPAVGLAEAQTLAGELNAEVERGTDPTLAPVVEPERKRMTVADAWDEYIKDCRRRGNKEKSTVKSDLAGRKDIVGVIGDKFLSDVSVDDIRAVIAAPLERAKSTKGKKRGGVATTGGARHSNRVLSIVGTLFKFALESGYDDLQRNPCSAVRPIKIITGSKQKRVLSVRELALLVMAARELDRENGGKSTWADTITLIVLNGNRKSEVYEATGDEWDSANTLWRIDAGRYKTGVDCILPVSPTSAAIFERRAKPGQFLIPRQSGVRTGQDRHICDRLTALMVEIGGEPVERWSMHCVRYGFRSWIRKTKIADSELAERIIHPGRGGDMSVHYDPDWLDEMREALAAWDKRIAAEIAAITASRIAVAA